MERPKAHATNLVARGGAQERTGLLNVQAPTVMYNTETGLEFWHEIGSLLAIEFINIFRDLQKAVLPLDILSSAANFTKRVDALHNSCWPGFCSHSPDTSMTNDC